MEIQYLEKDEVELLIDLQPSGWPDILPFFTFYTNSDFCFPIKATIDNTIVGIGAYIIHGDVAWLAHIIVHPDHRNKGIGQLITQILVDGAKTKSCHTIYLIASDLGVPVYEKIGFETETEYLFFQGLKKDGVWEISKYIRPFSDDMKHQIVQLDKSVSREDRVLHMEEHLHGGFVYKEGNTIEGFYLPSFGEGLILANTSVAGLELMKLRLSTKVNAVFPSDNSVAMDFMEKYNHKIFKKAKRMRLGVKKEVQLTNIYNRIGGYIG